MNTVQWSDHALDQFAGLYLAAEPADRAALAAASDAVDGLLRTDPFGEGESREGSERVIFFGRLTVYFFPGISPEPPQIAWIHWRSRPVP